MTTKKSSRKVNRAQFGSVRRLPSGRWQARYPDPDGAPMKAPRTFETADDAWAHIATVRADRYRGIYHDPRKGERLLGDFALEWIANGGNGGNLAPRTRALYLDLLARHIDPSLGKRPLGSITSELVRSWRTALLRELAARAAVPTKTGGKRVATGDARTRQAYALLRSVMATAKADGLIGTNPCQVRGAGVAKSPERMLLSLADFSSLVDSHPDHLRPVLHLAMGAHLRLGELIALQRRDLDLDEGTLRVERQVTADGEAPTPTKTGKADTVDLPSITVDVMREYLRSVPKALPGAPLFVRPDGRPLTRAMITQNWVKVRRNLGLPSVRFHDIRHAGLTMSAQGGATIAELRKRARHTTNAAAMVYQHAAEERGKIVAAGLDSALRSGSE